MTIKPDRGELPDKQGRENGRRKNRFIYYYYIVKQVKEKMGADCAPMEYLFGFRVKRKG
jgi:hypothetical protein